MVSRHGPDRLVADPALGGQLTQDSMAGIGGVVRSPS
jgi:hypothetical protein